MGREVGSKNRLVKDDILSMKLDLTNSKLSFKKNNIDCGKLNVTPGEYRGAKNLFALNESITLMILFSTYNSRRFSV